MTDHPKAVDGPGSAEGSNIEPSHRKEEAQVEKTESLKSRLSGLKKLREQILKPLSLVSAGAAVYKFFVSAGEITFPVLALGAFALFALLSASRHSTRIFAFRILGFIVDLVLLATVTIGGLYVYRASYGLPSSEILTLVVWVWFLYFVFFDWRFHGTLGKRLFGLRVVSLQKEFTIFTSFIRCFVSLILPVVVASWAGEAVMVARLSPANFLVGLGIRQALLLVNPVSILLLGGTRVSLTEFSGRKSVTNTAVKQLLWLSNERTGCWLA